MKMTSSYTLKSIVHTCRIPYVRLLLKCSLKGDTILLLENTGSIFVSNQSKRYKQRIAGLKEAFPTVRDKSVLSREFYSNQQNVERSFYLTVFEAESLDASLTAW